MKEVNFYTYFKQEIIPKVMTELGYHNIWQIPQITKVVINVGVGKLVKEPHYIEHVEKTLTRITGQKPVRTQAKKSISNFKIREGMDVGVMVTLRGSRMYSFLEKLLKVTLPRMRDFHGISSRSFDKHGNYALGFKEQVSFPEVKMEEIDKIHGLQVIISTTAKNKQEGMVLLKQMGFPFTK